MMIPPQTPLMMQNWPPRPQQALPPTINYFYMDQPVANKAVILSLANRINQLQAQLSQQAQQLQKAPTLVEKPDNKPSISLPKAAVLGALINGVISLTGFLLVGLFARDKTLTKIAADNLLSSPIRGAIFGTLLGWLLRK